MQLNRRNFVGACSLGIPAVMGMGEAAWAAPVDASDFPKLDWRRDWPWWRGPERNGHCSTDTRLPTKFGERQGVVWKAPLPGRGHSSPCVVGDAIYLTTADEKMEVQSVLSLQRSSGQVVWKRDLNQGGFPENNHAKNTEATPSIACDGELVMACFFHHQSVFLTALDLTGKEVWKQRVGDFNPRRYEYGYAPSPVMYRQMVIVAAEHDGESYIAALNRRDGREVWRTPRPQSISFSTPSIGNVAGRDQLMMSGQGQVASYDPMTGKPLWSTSGTTAATCGTMVWAGDVALASGGYPDSQTIAVKADGSRKVLWKNAQKCYEQSMIAVRSSAGVPEDYLYALTDNGIAFCWRVSDGQEMWKERLKGPVSASPIYSGGNIYWANELGTMYVFAANPEKFTLVAENRLGEESMASPAVSSNRLILRVATGRG